MLTRLIYFSSCSAWAERDFCTNNNYKTFMQTNCEKSCADKGLQGFCSSETTKSTIAVEKTTIAATTGTTAVKCTDNSFRYDAVHNFTDYKL